MDTFRRISVTLTILFVSLVSFAQNENTGFQNLLIPADAFYLGSAQSGSALVNTSSSLFISSFMHPDFVKNSDVTFSRYNYLADIHVNSLTSRLTLFEQPIQLGWQKLTADDIELRDKPGSAQGLTQAYWITAGIGTTFQWLDSDWGVSYKYVLQKLYLTENAAHVFDVSFSNKPFRNAGLLFVALQNIGFAEKIADQSVNLPLIIKTGWILYDKELTSDMNFKWLNETSFLLASTKFQSNNGLYLSAFRYFIAQVGYRLGHDTNLFSAGIGVVYQPFIVNYAFNYFKNGFSPTHAFTVSYRFN